MRPFPVFSLPVGSLSAERPNSVLARPSFLASSPFFFFLFAVCLLFVFRASYLASSPRRLTVHDFPTAF